MRSKTLLVALFLVVALPCAVIAQGHRTATSQKAAPVAAASAGRLVADLSEADAAVAVRAMNGLVALGPSAIPAMAAGLRDSDPQVHLYIARAVIASPRVFAALLPDLVKALSVETEDLSRSAEFKAISLYGSAGKDAVPSIIQEINATRQHPENAMAALKAMGPAGAEAALPLARRAEEINPGYTPQYAEIIAGMGPSASAAAPFVVSWLRLENVRWRVAPSVGKMGDPAFTILERALRGDVSDFDSATVAAINFDGSVEDLRVGAAAALGYFGPRGVPLLLGVLSQPDTAQLMRMWYGRTTLHVAAIKALGIAGAAAAPALPVLQKLLADDKLGRVARESYSAIRKATSGS